MRNPALPPINNNGMSLSKKPKCTLTMQHLLNACQADLAAAISNHAQKEAKLEARIAELEAAAAREDQLRSMDNPNMEISLRLIAGLEAVGRVADWVRDTDSGTVLGRDLCAAQVAFEDTQSLLGLSNATNPDAAAAKDKLERALTEQYLDNRQTPGAKQVRESDDPTGSALFYGPGVNIYWKGV